MQIPDPPQPGAPLVALDEVSLTLPSAAGPVDILRGVSLTVMPGETVALLGPSGSGKSTLMMVMAGLERPSAGQVALAGNDLGGLDEDRLARLRGSRVGIVFQAFHLIPTMTALENVAAPLELAGARDAGDRAKAELEQVGLRDRLAHYPAQLSGGEQQRVALARALAPRPSLLIADEPTGNLDQTTGAAVTDCLFAERERHGTALVLITHDPDLAERCDRQLRMADGRIVEDRRRAPLRRAL